MTGKELKELRTSISLSVKELAKLIPISAVAVYQYEDGRHKIPACIEKLVLQEVKKLQKKQFTLKV